ncbi:aquaporin-2 [Coniochaeta sp. 2T2.1]|nr:aquaporin-2 [Coniochaeta sp. 2T2.1]
MPGLPDSSAGDSRAPGTDNRRHSFSKLMGKLKLASDTSPVRMASHDSNPVVTTTPHHTSRLKISDTVRNNIVAVLAEFVGTFMFLFLAFAGTQVANGLSVPTLPTEDVYDPTILILISLSFGFSLLANAWAFYRVSGGLFNPAVSLALFLVGGISPVRAILVSIAQIIGGIAAAGLVAGLFPGPLKVGTSLRPGTSSTQGLFIEMFLTAELVFVIIMLAAEKHRSTHMAPLGIGIAFFVTELAGVFLTGGSLNPARSFGPSVITGHFGSYHWIYWVGPLLGALLASGFFVLLRRLRYRECNPGPDWEDMEKIHPTQGPL